MSCNLCKGTGKVDATTGADIYTYEVRCPACNIATPGQGSAIGRDPHGGPLHGDAAMSRLLRDGPRFLDTPTGMKPAKRTQREAVRLAFCFPVLEVSDILAGADDGTLTLEMRREIAEVLAHRAEAQKHEDKLFDLMNKADGYDKEKQW